MKIQFSKILARVTPLQSRHFLCMDSRDVKIPKSRRTLLKSSDPCFVDPVLWHYWRLITSDKKHGNVTYPLQLQLSSVSGGPQQQLSTLQLLEDSTGSGSLGLGRSATASKSDPEHTSRVARIELTSDISSTHSPLTQGKSVPPDHSRLLVVSLSDKWWTTTGFLKRHCWSAFMLHLDEFLHWQHALTSSI